MTPAPARPNPYVGPRPFGAGEPLYGRDRAVRQLTNRLVADRIVVLFGTSGAGKTSLIRAAVLPAFEKLGFAVLPVIRVGRPPPAGPGARPNRYVSSALLSLGWDGSGPTGGSGRASLASHLDARRASGGDGPELLVFDQLEEVLTLDPTDHAAKVEFFAELGAALADPRRWALFAVREDCLGALAPYAAAVPTHLGNTFRLDLLTPSEAREAIARPASAAGVSFTPAALDLLVAELRRVPVTDPAGDTEARGGDRIEPAHLQIACRALWDRLPAAHPPAAITELDVASLTDQPGIAREALTAYYASVVREVALRYGVPERTVREWCERRLITRSGSREAVVIGNTSSYGLANVVIESLVDHYLLRSEDRNGVKLVELSHDRLVEPIRVDNARWRGSRLPAWVPRAAEWIDRGYPNGLLLTGEELWVGLRFERAQPEMLTREERQFLYGSLARVRRRRWQLLLVAWLLLLGVLAWYFLGR
jgi:hypothetical protein